MPQITVKIQTSSSGVNKVTIKPTRLKIPYGPSNIVITWKASNGTTFLPTPDCFQWMNLPGQPDPPEVTRTDDTTLTSASYSNQYGFEVAWEYLIGVEKDGVKIQVDPEVDNDPPRPIDETVGFQPDPAIPNVT